MKTFLATLLITSLSINNIHASVASDVELLGKLAMGKDVHAVKGKNAEALFLNWLENENGEDDERKLVNKEIEEMDYGDEVFEGFTSTRSAIAMKDFAISSLEENLEDLEHTDIHPAALETIKARIYDLDKKWALVIKRLDKQGVRFGYTGHGPGYCGVSFIELIIVDPKEQKVYEVYLSEGGEC